MRLNKIIPNKKKSQKTKKKNCKIKTNKNIKNYTLTNTKDHCQRGKLSIYNP